MHIPLPQNPIVFPPEETPKVVVIVDAEEEFDWGTYARSQTSVRNIGSQGPSQRIFEKYGIVPTYAVTYPVATQPDGIRPLREFLQDGRCEIGAQLHSWVTPPFEEELGERNSYAGNLAPALEFAKLNALTRAIEDNFAIGPGLYRAGRYGFGAHTASSLARLGYRVDCSMLPWVDKRQRFGPDYRRVGVTPFWLDSDRSLMEIPYTVGLVGALGRISLGARLYPLIASAAGVRLRLPALLSRLGMLNRIPLSPEGTSLKEAKLATRRLLELGHRVFCVSFHSPSLLPGLTPYVSNHGERAALLDWLDQFFDYFLGEIGGRPATPDQVRERALSLRPPVKCPAEATARPRAARLL
jgi:hypothetical protein